jgi:chromosome partitioning protein
VPDSPNRISVQDARTRFRELLDRARQGERFLITRHGDVVAALIGPQDHHRLAQLPPQEGPMHVLTVYNQAGGAGKTTVTRDLGYALKERGLRVLLVDLDAQASLTRWLGLLSPQDHQPSPPALLLSRTVFPVLSDPDADLPPALSAFGLDVLPANSKLSVGDALLYDDQSRVAQLRSALRRLSGYDVILIDAPPGRTAMALAAVAAADHLLVPVNASKALDNIHNVAEVMNVARTFAPDLKVLAFVPHSFIPHTNHHKDVLTYLKNDLKGLAPTTTPIHHKTTLYHDATMFQRPIAVHAPRQSPRAEYDHLAGEIMELLGLTQQAGAGV